LHREDGGGKSGHGDGDPDDDDRDDGERAKRALMTVGEREYADSLHRDVCGKGRSPAVGANNRETRAELQALANVHMTGVWNSACLTRDSMQLFLFLRSEHDEWMTADSMFS
jgi:hypothetical protein